MVKIVILKIKLYYLSINSIISIILFINRINLLLRWFKLFFLLFPSSSALGIGLSRLHFGSNVGVSTNYLGCCCFKWLCLLDFFMWYCVQLDFMRTDHLSNCVIFWCNKRIIRIRSIIETFSRYLFTHEDSAWNISKGRFSN